MDQVNEEHVQDIINNEIISEQTKDVNILMSSDNANAKPTKLSVRRFKKLRDLTDVVGSQMQPHAEKIKNKIVDNAYIFYEKYIHNNITRQNQPDILGYVVITLMMYNLSFTFNMFTILFCIGIAYIGAIDYYNNQINIPNTYVQNTDGLVSLCSIIIFDGILDFFGSFDIAFMSVIFLITRIIMHTFFCEFFVNFMTNNKSIINRNEEAIKPLYQQTNRVYNINNFFQSVFTDMIICNNVICEKVCVEYNTYLIMTLLQPITIIKTFDYKLMIKNTKNTNIDIDNSHNLHIQ